MSSMRSVVKNTLLQAVLYGTSTLGLAIYFSACLGLYPCRCVLRAVHGAHFGGLSVRRAETAHLTFHLGPQIHAVMTVLALIVINKAGGLVYNKSFQDAGLNKISTNDYLVLAGTFHGVHAITARLNPVKAPPPPLAANGLPSRPEPSSGLEVMETENFRLQCFNTLTGTKFLLFTDSTQANVDVTLKKIYDLYSDYVMKNPFYSLEMPIRCDIFDRKLLSYIREINNR